MIKIIKYIIIIAFLSSCSYIDIKRLDKMECPVIVYAKSPKIYYRKSQSIILIDKKGDMKVFYTRHQFAANLDENYFIGDTVKYCINK